MSGFWSFRECGSGSAAAANSASGLQQLDLAVTQVLPVGMEFKRATLSTAQEGAHTRFGRKVAPHVEAAEWTGGTDCGPAKKLARQAVLSSSQSMSVEANDAAVKEGWVNAYLVDREEVMDAVQRSWWETLDVDVRPGLPLSSVCIAPAKVDTPDAETLELVREFLYRASGNVPGRETARSRDSAFLRCEVRLSERKEQRTCLDRSPASEVQMKSRKNAKHTDSRSFRSTVPRGPSLHTERLARLREQSTSTAALQLSEGEMSKSKAGSCYSQDHGGVAKDTTVVSHVSSRPEGQGSSEHEANFGTGTVAPLETQSESFSPSAVLQDVLRTHSRRVSLSSTAATRMEVIRRREELLLLRRYFALWLSAAEQRHIKQCAASYHCFLMRCINDTIEHTTPQVKEEESICAYRHCVSGLAKRQGKRA
ncbi:conserved hypothetical protein [Leishmania major strain Friedlin]|uniref:Uncharacterized protein n=1 Tax=Leishmania major TaxID=5664 RepID=Q4Q7M6_LEIMA|nr:conserved hypothetical protein [Leishmania major strain Friedlin]CAG9578253.1 hypothetical_protein_-_conserved [Leishmania major strain Friedlin]CAJ06032.1 conserved hypothetical protein [Leishmania major strain Friedlin]|eukprot:XP_001684672.1 conserved hypothetical protein [Leishmania major strain Friedlin]